MTDESQINTFEYVVEVNLVDAVGTEKLSLISIRHSCRFHSLNDPSLFKEFHNMSRLCKARHEQDTDLHDWPKHGGGIHILSLLVEFGVLFL